MKYTFTLLLVGSILVSSITAQSVAINTDASAAATSALLDVKSTTKGVLVPRMTKVEKNAIATPATGLLVYQNAPDSIGFHYYNSTQWIWLAGANNIDSSKWRNVGATNIANKNSGNVGISTGNATPNSTLQVDGTLAIGVQIGILGGDAATPVSLSANKSYLGLEPLGTNNCYELPNAALYPGRIYFLRNNLNSGALARVRAALPSLLCPGSGNCLGMSAYYDLQNNASVKTIIVISDGLNWTLGKFD